MDTIFSVEANPYALSLLLPVAISVFLAIEAWKPRFEPNGRVFSLLMIAIAIWSAAYGLELASTTFESMVFWLKVEYIAIPFITPLMLLLVYRITDISGGAKANRFSYLIIIPVLTMFFSITNEYHNIYYSGITLEASGKLALLNLEFGPWYYVHVVYSYLLIFVALYLLIRKLYYQHALFRNQLLFLLLALLIPLIVFSVYFLGYMPVENIDPTPFAFALSGVAISVSILRFRMLDLMPIAREHVFQSMSDGLVVVDNKDRLIDCNPYGLAIFGWKRIPYGEPASVLWPGQSTFLQHLQSSEGDNYEMILGTGETKRVYLTSVSDILNFKRLKVGKLMIIHDITHRHLLQEKIRISEEKLRLMNSEKDKLFSIIGHDLRGPISSFIGLTEMFADETYGISPYEMKVLAKQMNDSARSLHGLLENLLEWAKMQREEVKVEKDFVVLNQLFERVFRLYRENFNSKSITFSNQLPAGLRVYADENMLFTLVRNLVSNALKFTPRGGQITIAAVDCQPGEVGFMVCDTGIGIPPKILEGLFSLDMKTSRPGTEGETSTGLGLILAQEFAERNQGKIAVESEVGKGSCFKVVFSGQE
jgi:signal transduction histidine kinase